MEEVIRKNHGFHVLQKLSTVFSRENREMDSVESQQMPPNLTPSEIMLLKYAPVSTAAVERSFSRYRNLLTSNRQRFCEKSISEHLFVQVNIHL